jgi:digeranylgeranylglycerophospholipid reductase
MEKVVIIGGGIGGLVTAKTLAKEGIPPLLVEKNKTFGQKACGEMVTEEFFGLNLYQFLEKEEVILRKSEKMVINFADRDYFFDLKNSSLGLKKVVQLDKRAFEEELAEEAKEFGAKIFLGKEVKKLERKKDSILIDGEIEAKLVIGADGFHSVCRKFVGQKIKSYGFAISGYGKSEREYPTFFFDPEISKEGCGWIFPRQGGEANVGFGGLEAEKVKSSLEKFLSKFGLKIENEKGAFLPTQLPFRLSFDNLILVGEAGALTDPFWGAGIASAIFSGYLAGKMAKEAVEKNDFSAKFLRKYEKEVKEKIYLKSFRNLLLQKIFSFLLPHKKTVNLLLKILSRL